MRPAAGVLLAAILFLSSGLVGWGRYGEGALIDPVQLGAPDGSNGLLRTGRVQPWEAETTETGIQKVMRVVEYSDLGTRGTPTGRAGLSSRSTASTRSATSTRTTSSPEPPEPRATVDRGVADEPKSAPKENGGPEVKDDATESEPDKDAPIGADNDKGAPDIEANLPEVSKQKPEPPAKETNPEADAKKKNPTKGGSAKDGKD